MAVVLTDKLPLRASKVDPREGCRFGKAKKGSMRKRSLSCELGTLAGGASKTIKVKVRPRTGKQLRNTANVTSATTDSDPANNTVIARTKVRRP